MIASWIFKRIIRSSFKKWNEDDPDVESLTAMVHDDAIWELSSEIGPTETAKGKKVIIEWLTRWKEEFPKRRYDVKSICFSSWPFCLKNIVTLQFTLTQTDKKGKTFKWEGITVFHMRNFKVMYASDYISFAGLPKLSDLIEPLAED